MAVDPDNRSRAAWSLWPVPRSLNAPVAFVVDDVNRQQLLANMSLPASVRAQAAAGRIQEGLTAALSRRNLMSAEALVAVLAHERDGANASPLLASLPVAGVDGTLAERMRGAASVAVAAIDALTVRLAGFSRR